MSTARTLVIAAVAMFCGKAVALEVMIFEPVTASCGQPYGVLRAEISGGVPPYSISWSTGDTTATIGDLYPGTYSVTVTDFVGTQAYAEAEVIDAPFQAGGFMSSTGVHCTGELPEARLTLSYLGEEGFPVWGPEPHTIILDGTVVGAVYEPCMSCSPDWLTGFYRVQVDAPPGSVYSSIDWVDANGCPGSTTVSLSNEVQWPPVQILDVQGACSFGANGSFTATFYSERTLAVLVRDAQGNTVGPFDRYTSDFGTWSREFTGLEAGDYQVILITDAWGPYDDESCADTTTITIPDLGDGCGNVSGRVFIDGNANCNWGVGENLLPQAIVEFTPGPLYASTNTIGNYSANLPMATYDHDVIHPGAQQECPGPFTLSAGQGLVTESIGCSALFPLDVQVSLANGPARPGFDFEYALNLRNNTAANAGTSTLTLVFDANLVFGSALPAPSSVAGNTLTWNLSGVNAYANTTYHIYFTVPSDVGLIGTTLITTATVSTTNTDAVPANNTWTSSQVVTASFDPNSKGSRTSSYWSDELYFIDVDQYIDYTLHFQNTGTDTAFLVVVTDTLPATLDPASVQVGAASDPFTWSLGGAGTLTFNFANVLLPDSNVNEAASHGFVSFRIKPRQPLLPGTVIENTANIFFDYNDPVITAPSVLTAEFSTAVGEDPSPGQLSVFPNPADRSIDVISGTGAIHDVEIRTLDGRLSRTIGASARRVGIDLAGLAPGAYVLKVTMTDGAVHQQRFVKY